MARPEKKGLDYFPLDCHMDDKFKLLIGQYGPKAFSVIVHLFQKIYGEEGYYCEWNEDISILMASELSMGAESNLIMNIVDKAMQRNFFSRDLYEKYGILTSAGIQRRYLAAVSRRTSVEVKKEYLLLTDVKNVENVNINGINADRNPKNVSSNTQSKVNKKKENKRIKDMCSEQSGIAAEPAVISLTLNDNSLHDVYQRDVDGWTELYPAVDVLQELKKIKGWLDSNPTKRKTGRGIARFINSWMAREQDKYHGSTGSSPSGSRNSFNHYQQNQYDYDDLMKRIKVN